MLYQSNIRVFISQKHKLSVSSLHCIYSLYVWQNKMMVRWIAGLSTLKLYVHRPILQKSWAKNCQLVLLGHKIYRPILLLADFRNWAWTISRRYSVEPANQRQQKSRQWAWLTLFHLWKNNVYNNAEVCLLCQHTYNWPWPLHMNLKQLHRLRANRQ